MCFVRVYRGVPRESLWIPHSIVKSKKIVIKINMVSPTNILSMTPPDAVEFLLRVLRDKYGYGGEVIIAEGSAGDTWLGFRRGGFDRIAKRYNAELFDIHEDASYSVEVFNHKLEIFRIPVSRLLVDSDALISICRAKTHDTVVVTLSIKNVAVGGIVGVDNRPKIHQGYRAINLNIAILGAIMFPDLAIVDGRIGMQGDGPVWGFEKTWGYVFSSHNALCLDTVVARSMGFDPTNIGYLYYLSRLGFGDTEYIKLDGFTIEDIKTSFKPHRTYQKQLDWKLDSETEKTILRQVEKIISRFPRARRVVEY